MHALPPAASPLVVGINSPWIPPIRFGVKAYLELCRSFDQALAELEALYPSRPRVLTLEARNEKLQRRPK